MVGQGRKRKEEDVDDGALPTGLATPPKQKKRKEAASTKTETPVTPPPTVKAETPQAPPTLQTPYHYRERIVPPNPETTRAKRRPSSAAIVFNPDGTTQVLRPETRVTYCDCRIPARRLRCQFGSPENVGKSYYICKNKGSRVKRGCDYFHWVETVAEAARRERAYLNRPVHYSETDAEAARMEHAYLNRPVYSYRRYRAVRRPI
jgi:hypothetical protein